MWLGTENACSSEGEQFISSLPSRRLPGATTPSGWFSSHPHLHEDVDIYGFCCFSFTVLGPPFSHKTVNVNQTTSSSWAYPGLDTMLVFHHLWLLRKPFTKKRSRRLSVLWLVKRKGGLTRAQTSPMRFKIMCIS